MPVLCVAAQEWSSRVCMHLWLRLHGMANGGSLGPRSGSIGVGVRILSY